MSSLLDKKQKAFGYVNTALSILDKLPSMNSTNSFMSLNMSSDPFEFLLDLMVSTIGYEEVVNKISEMVSHITPIMENTTKGLLLANMTKLISTCSINPFISYDLLKYGVVLDLHSIDIRNTLSLCPLDRDKVVFGGFKEYNANGKVKVVKTAANFVNSMTNYRGGEQRIGSYFYHDCDNFSITDELVKSKDFNAFTWFAKNRSIGRCVWYGSDEQEKAPLKSVFAKQRKEDGILTLEYTPSPGLLQTSDGEKMEVQVPYRECLHVFIGNVKQVSPDAEALQKRQAELTAILGKYNDLENLCLDLEYEIKERKKVRNGNEMVSENRLGHGRLDVDLIQANDDSLSIGGVPIVENVPLNEQTQNAINDFSLSDLSMNDEKKLQIVRKALDGQGGKSVGQYLKNHNVRVNKTADNDYATIVFETLDRSLTIPGDCYSSSRKIVEKELRKLYGAMYQMGSLNDAYRTVEQNYYFGKTLIEFNTDYVMSLKLFDSKVIAAQLIDSLTNCLNFNTSLSIEDTYVKEQVTRMVQDIVRSDDTVVSDCFFSFSNDDYNAMLEKTQLRRAGLYTDKGEENNINQVTAEEILSNLNTLNSDSTKEEIQSVIASSIFAISKAVNYTEENGGGINVQGDLSFLEKMLVNFVMSIINSLLSPKVYLIIAVNLELFGKNPSFNILDFITMNKSFITELIRNIRDKVIEYLTDILMATIGDIAKAISTKLVLEQYEYYKELITSCIECFRNNTQDWNMADVTADIYDTGVETPANKEC